MCAGRRGAPLRGYLLASDSSISAPLHRYSYVFRSMGVILSTPLVSYHGVYKHGGRKYTSRMLSRAPLHRGAREHLVVEPLPTELEISLTHGQAGLVPLLSS